MFMAELNSPVTHILYLYTAIKNYVQEFDHRNGNKALKLLLKQVKPIATHKI